MAGKLDDYLNFNQNALALRGQRQQQLASNIANADTPNYKARDIDFAATLKGKLKAGAGVAAGVAAVPGVGLAQTSTMHLAGKQQPPTAVVRGADGSLYRTVEQASVDGNTVDMDTERNQFTDNALHYEATVTAVNGQIKSLLSAITGGQ